MGTGEVASEVSTPVAPLHVPASCRLGEITSAFFVGEWTMPFTVFCFVGDSVKVYSACGCVNGRGAGGVVFIDVVFHADS